MSLRVLIVDDHEPFLDEARNLLEREGLHVAGVASTTEQALGRAEQLQPDVALVDIVLGEESGVDLARQLATGDRGDRPAVILISTHAADDVADLIADSPALGFVSKSELSAASIRRVLNGSAG